MEHRVCVQMAEDESKEESRTKDRQIRHAVVISGGRVMPGRAVIGVITGAGRRSQSVLVQEGRGKVEKN